MNCASFHENLDLNFCRSALCFHLLLGRVVRRRICLYSIWVLKVLVDHLFNVVVMGLGETEFSQLLEEDARRRGCHVLTLRALENICLSLVSYTSSISQTELI